MDGWIDTVDTQTDKKRGEYENVEGQWGRQAGRLP